MFGLSSLELLFVAVLALILIGPRDLPDVIRSFSSGVARCRKMVQDLRGSVSQLEREIDIVENPDPGQPEWLDFLPDEIKELRASIQPHGDPEETAQKYRTVKTAVAKARRDCLERNADSATQCSNEIADKSARA